MSTETDLRSELMMMMVFHRNMSCKICSVCGGKLTCDREVVERWEAVVTGHLRLLFVTNEGAIAL